MFGGLSAYEMTGHTNTKQGCLTQNATENTTCIPRSDKLHHKKTASVGTL